jgi:thiamine-phosphate pyrophosphorylase
MSQSRLFDALFNRLREATRVLEDHYRFIEDRAGLTAEIKALRHQILKLERETFKGQNRERRVASDVGRHNKAPASSARSNATDVADASWSRLQESLRSLEEQFKLHNNVRATEAEALRYTVYALQQEALSYRARQWPLYALITESLSSHPLEKLIADFAKAGVGAIQIREKEMPDKKLLARLKQVKKLCDKYSKNKDKKIQLIVNDRPDLAVLADFDGVHVGQSDLTPKEIKKLFGSRLFVGLSTHSPKQAKAAITQGADYIGIGPVFPTQTKPHLKFIGLKSVTAMTKISKQIPHVVIGGINEKNLASVITAGAKGVAVCSALIQAKSPGATAKKIIRFF